MYFPIVNIGIQCVVYDGLIEIGRVIIIPHWSEEPMALFEDFVVCSATMIPSWSYMILSGSDIGQGLSLKN